jgi:N-acyl homoserine lactone hydrolase
MTQGIGAVMKFKRNTWAWGGLLATVMALAACGMPALPEPSAKADLGQALPTAHPPADLSFSVIKTGESKGALEGLLVAGGSLFQQRHLAQSAVLVRHPKVTFLFDTGLGRQVDKQFAVNTWLDKQFFAYTAVNPAADQLQKAGWQLDAISMIVPSHMHWDHISGLDDFPTAQVWATPTERQHAEQGHAPGFLASQFEHVRNWHELKFDQGAAYLGFDRSLDMFGDGAVVLVPLSGHTAGQVGMFLTLSSGQRYFFTGDVTWTIEGLRTPADRSWLLRQVVHVDHDEAANQACIVHIHQIMQRFPALTVVPAHDEHVLQTLPRFPQFKG